jgi:hypothetical protein
LKALGRLAGGIAHDFHNALGLMAGQVNLLQRDIGAGPHSATLAGLSQALEQAARLPRQLLTLMHEGESTGQPIDVDALTCSLGGLLGASLPEDVRVEVQATAAPWRLRGDPGQLAQALLALCFEAVDSLSAGGLLLVRTERVLVSAGDAVGKPEARPGRYVRLTVQASGDGMAAIRRYDAPGTGSGAGTALATVRPIVRQQQGWLEEGLPATFALYLPADAGSEADVEPPPALPVVLVVDSDPHVRAWNARALQTAGFQPLLADRLTIAVEQCRTTRPVELLLIEQELLRWSPQELASELNHLADCAWVVVTAGEGLDLPPSLARRVRGVLPKPYGLAELLRAVRGGLHQMQ